MCLHHARGKSGSNSWAPGVESAVGATRTGIGQQGTAASLCNKSSSMLSASIQWPLHMQAAAGSHRGNHVLGHILEHMQGSAKTLKRSLCLGDLKAFRLDSYSGRPMRPSAMSDFAFLSHLYIYVDVQLAPKQTLPKDAAYVVAQVLD